MKGRTRITINRETLTGLLEEHLAKTLVGSYKLHEHTIHRNGSIELVVTPMQSQKEKEPELPLGEGTKLIDGMGNDIKQ